MVSSVISVHLKQKSKWNNQVTAFSLPTSGNIYYHEMDFHFVSNGCFAVEAELNMPRGLELDWCLIFRGKQTHTGTRHGCHISLSFPVVPPEGSRQGRPLCSGRTMKIYIRRRQRCICCRLTQTDSSICCSCCSRCVLSLS